MAVVADQHDRVPLRGELLRLDVDLGDERAGGVDRIQPSRRGAGVNARGHAVGREHHRRAGWDLSLRLNEHGSALAELLHDVLVVDDLLAHVDRRAMKLQRALDRLHGPIHARAIAPRRGQQQLLR